MTERVQLEFSESELEKLLTEALRLAREGDLIGLADSPLAGLPLIEAWYSGSQPRDSAELGRALQAFLSWLIERLQPPGDHSWTKLSWRPYNVLSAFYLEGRRIAEIAELLAVAEQTVYPIRAQAINALATLIQEDFLSGNMAINYALQTSYPTLPEAQQRLLRLFSVPATDMSQDVLYRLAQADEIPALEYHLQALITQGMIETDPQRSRFCLVPKLRPFLRTLLPPHERHTWHTIACDTALERARWLRAAQHAYYAGEQTRASEIVIQHYQAIIDAFEAAELRKLLAQIQATDVHDAQLWDRLKLVSGDVALTMDDVPSALREYQQALSSATMLTKAEAYYKRGRAFRSHNTAEAEAHLNYCIELLESVHSDAPLLYQAYLEQAWMLFQDRQEWQQAEYSLQAAETLISVTDRVAQAELANAWGMYYSHRGNHLKAKQYHRDAWLAANETQDAFLLTHMSHNLGNDYMALREYDQALVYFRQSAELAHETANRRMEGLCEKSLGACCFWLGVYQQAIDHYERAYTIFSAMQNRNWLANTCYDLAEAHAELGQTEAMQRYFSQAIELARTSGLERLLNDLHTLAHSYPGLYPPTIALNERQQQLFDYLKTNPSITNRDYRDLTNISPKQASRDLNELVDQKIIVRIGEGRSTAYCLAAQA